MDTFCDGNRTRKSKYKAMEGLNGFSGHKIQKQISAYCFYIPFFLVVDKSIKWIQCRKCKFYWETSWPHFQMPVLTVYNDQVV